MDTKSQSLLLLEWNRKRVKILELNVIWLLINVKLLKETRYSETAKIPRK